MAKKITYKSKAKGLIRKFGNSIALLVIDEIVEEVLKIHDDALKMGYIDFPAERSSLLKWWRLVKEEINNSK